MKVGHFFTLFDIVIAVQYYNTLRMCQVSIEIWQLCVTEVIILHVPLMRMHRVLQLSNS